MRHLVRGGAVAAAVVLMMAGVSSAASAQTLEELLAKNYQSRGGLEKLKSITSIKVTGRLTAQGNQMVMTTWMKRPNMMRQEMDVQGQKVVQAFDGTHAWALNPMMGTSTPVEVPGAQADLIKSGADFDGPLVDYKAKGNTLELEGTDTVDGAKVFRIKVTPKSGPPLTLYLDATTGLERKMSAEVDQGGQRMTVETLMSDYRTVSGIQLPFSVRTMMNGQLAAEVTIQSYDVNLPLDEAMFKMPGK